MSDVSSVGYSNSVKQDFTKKIAYMASSETGSSVSIFMDAMDNNTTMRTTIDDLLKEQEGSMPDKKDCEGLVEKLINLVKGLFNSNAPEQKTESETEKSDDEKQEDDKMNFTFETNTDAA